MTRFACFVVGEGALVLSCLEILLEQGCDVLGACSTDRSVREWTGANKIVHTKDPAIFE